MSRIPGHLPATLTTLLGVFVAIPTLAADIPIAARKVIVIDRPDVISRSRVIFVAKDPAITKGAGVNPEDISAQLTGAYADGSTTGVTSIPAGTANGWRSNTAALAKYTNPAAPAAPRMPSSPSSGPGGC